MSIKCRYVDDNGDLQFSQICAGQIKDAIIPAITICQQPKLFATIPTLGNECPIPSIYQPQPRQYIELVPNVIAWPPINSSDHDVMKAIWEEYLGFGFNTLPVGTGTVVDDPVILRTDNAYIDNWLTIQEELGDLPIQLESSFGHKRTWDDDLAGAMIWRTGDPGSSTDPNERSHYTNYHTNVEVAALLVGNMQAMIDENVGVPESGNYASSIRFLHCPNSKSTTAYINALAKLNEYCKWLKPQAVHFDNEYINSYNGANSSIKDRIASDIGVDGCTRCNNAAGYIAGVDQIGLDISSIVRTYSKVSNPMIMQFNLYNNSNSLEDHRWWKFNRDTGFIVGNPGIYRLTYNSNTDVGSRTVYSTGLVDRFLRLRNGTAADSDYHGGPWERVQPQAINGSYVYISQRLDVYDYSMGYINPAEMYDLCYFLAGEGAFGFALFPGYGGKDKDSITYPPGSEEDLPWAYTAKEMADDISAKELYPIGIKAFNDYYSSHAQPSLPVLSL